jgi:membrane associated rhomboid family serine protease
MTDADLAATLADGQHLLDVGEPEAAIAPLLRATSAPDPEVAGAAWLALGTARYRTDDEPGALVAWQRAAETDFRSAWMGWRSVAEQQVRDGDLEAAIGSYREADRRAPAQEKGAIANRIAWLLKETGHDFAARRQFNRARGSYAAFTPYVTWAIMAVCVAAYLLDVVLTQGATLQFFGGTGPIGDAALIYAPYVAEGEYYRILTSAFIHLGFGHLAFNMLALNLFGGVLEQMYGRVEYLVIYLLCAAGGSVLTMLVAPGQAAAGASGAIFGLFGLAFVVPRRHRVATTREARAILGQAGSLLAINLVFTFLIPGISWTGHVGGLIVGAVIGFVVAPAHVPTMSSMFRRPDGTTLAPSASAAIRAAAYLAVTAGLALGTWVAVGVA